MSNDSNFTVLADGPRRPRAPRPPSDYSQVLASAQSLGLMRRAYGYYAVRITMLAVALAGCGWRSPSWGTAGTRWRSQQRSASC